MYSNPLSCPQLGAGTALPGVLAAMLGAQVTLSDAEHLPHCRESGINTCRHNQVTGVNTIGLTWGQYPPDLLNMTPVDLLLASDCFYDTKGKLFIWLFLHCSVVSLFHFNVELQVHFPASNESKYFKIKKHISMHE